MNTLIMEVLKLRYVEQDRNVRKLFKSVNFCKIVQWKTLKPVETPVLPSYRISCRHAFENDFILRVHCII